MSFFMSLSDLQGQMFAFIKMEAVPRCVKVGWDLLTVPVHHITSCQLMEKVALLPMLQMEQQVIFYTVLLMVQTLISCTSLYTV